jgi:hypothetical protein
MKKKKQARSCFREVLRREPQRGTAYYELACLDALERKREAVFSNLNRAVGCDLRDINRLRRDQKFAFLHSDPRWKSIIKRLQDLASI